VKKMILPELIITLGLLGWFIMVAFALLLTIINKYIGIVGIIFFIILGLDYYNYYSASNSTDIYYAWLTWFVAVLLMFESVYRMKTDRR